MYFNCSEKALHLRQKHVGKSLILIRTKLKSGDFVKTHEGVDVVEIKSFLIIHQDDC